eukprot:snap_masked-scaffold_81-processed-gene-0.33-mRNA-1 protein AED:1.00 eAED:1.00 QI:0/-1/0/0/-1/1/1/0/88
MKEYSIKEEEPRYIKEVEMLDGKVIPIKTIISAKAKLSQGETNFTLGLQKFFCVDMESWTDNIIGKKTLDYFNIKFNLRNVDRSKEKN